MYRVLILIVTALALSACYDEAKERRNVEGQLPPGCKFTETKYKGDPVFITDCSDAGTRAMTMTESHTEMIGKTAVRKTSGTIMIDGKSYDLVPTEQEQ